MSPWEERGQCRASLAETPSIPMMAQVRRSRARQTPAARRHRRAAGVPAVGAAGHLGRRDDYSTIRVPTIPASGWPPKEQMISYSPGDVGAEKVRSAVAPAATEPVSASASAIV